MVDPVYALYKFIVHGQNQRTSHSFVHHHESWQRKKQKQQTTYINRFISSLKLSKDGAFCEWDAFFFQNKILHGCHGSFKNRNYIFFKHKVCAIWFLQRSLILKSMC